MDHPPLRAPLILATDLDGTFAGGSAEDRVRLQRALAAQPGATLIYVTGRSVPATRELMREAALPWPDLLIADVGTTVVRGRAFESVVEVERALVADWPGGDAIRARLGAEWEEQEVRAPRRVSYWIAEGEDAERAAARARDRLSGLAVEVIGSAGCYLDVLPRGVNKGTTLRRVLAWLGRSAEAAVVAGDTLNDLALFEAGFAGIAVGNCEPALRARVRSRETVYVAVGHGAAGILEGLRHFGWLEGENDGE